MIRLVALSLQGKPAPVGRQEPVEGNCLGRHTPEQKGHRPKPGQRADDCSAEQRRTRRRHDDADVFRAGEVIRAEVRQLVHDVDGLSARTGHVGQRTGLGRACAAENEHDVADGGNRSSRLHPVGCRVAEAVGVLTAEVGIPGPQRADDRRGLLDHRAG